MLDAILAHAAVLVLCGIGGFIGVNFGGSMLLVMPAIIGLGWSPLVAVISSRPAIVGQSLTGLWCFRESRSIGLREHLTLAAGASAGALVGLTLLAGLDEQTGRYVVVGLVALLSLLAMSQRYLFARLGEDGSYSTDRPKAGALLLTGFAPGIIGGIIGTGAGLIVVASCLVLLRMRIANAAYAEKIVSLCHSLTTLIAAIWLQAIDVRLAVTMFIGVTLGAYAGARMTLRFSARWMYVTIVVLSMLVLFRLTVS